MNKSPGAPIRIAMPEGLEQLVPGYFERRKQDVPEMLSLLAASDFERLRMLAHNMKGSGASYGFTGLTEMGATLEASARAGDGPRLREELSRMENYLSRIELVEGPG